MRTIKKKLKVTIHKALVYNTKKKIEESVEIKVTELDNEFPTPKDCVLISSTVIEEKEFVYKMKPEDFVKNAEVEEA